MSNIDFIRTHQVYRDHEPRISLPLVDFNKRIHMAMQEGVCIGAALTAILGMTFVMVSGWAS